MGHDLLFRIRALLLRRRLDGEMDLELRDHLNREMEHNMSRGLSRDEAERQARAAIGPVTQIREECREARGVAWLESTLQDARYALRMLRKSPGFTLAVVLSLALGIGANTAIFSLMDAVMWRSLPVRQPEQLQLLARTDRGRTSYGFTHREFRRFREHNRAFTDLAAYGSAQLNVSIDGSAEPAAEAQLVTGAYFSLLGVTSAAGRTFTEEDDRTPNGHPIAIISHGYWRRRFGLAPGAIGRTIAISGTPFTIIGVTPPGFFGMEVGIGPDLFVPVMMQPAVMPSAENWLGASINQADWLRVIGRLKPEVTAREASSQIGALARSLQEEQPKEASQETVSAEPADLGLSDLRRQFSQPLAVLLSVTGLVLLIACANTANLLLARAASRRAEWTMRLALGAGRWRLIRQLLVESVTLALLGGACGLLLARWAARLLVAYLSTGRSPITLDLDPDLRVLAFTAAVSILTGVVFGIAPALRAARAGEAGGLRSRIGTRIGSRNMLRSGRVLVVAQVALSLVLIAGAGLFVRSLQRLNSQDAGFPRDNLLTVRVEPKGSDQRGVPGASIRLDRIYRDLAERVAAIPGVQAATLAQFTPTSRIRFSERVRFESGEWLQVQAMMVYPGYFATLGVPIAAGRDLGPGDLGEHSPLVAVVNEAFVRRYFQGANPVGRRYFKRPPRSYFTQPPPADPYLSCEIIGMVKDSRYANLSGETEPVIYHPFLQTNTGRGQMVLHVRTGANPSAMVPLIRRELQRIDREMPAFEIRTLAVEIDVALVRERLLATLSGVFGGLALLLACVGLYGLLAFASVHRTGEIGLRMALGARGGDVLWMILRDALLLTGAGVAIGVPAAIAVARFAASRIPGLLFGLSATDPTALGGAALILLAAGLLAAWLPARRASRVDPSTALRAE